MKRASRNSHRQYHNSVDEEAKARLKHQNLLQQFLELQKDFVSKKKKLETVNQMRGTLLNEVRFLRQRYSYLSMIKSQEEDELQQGSSVQSQNSYLQSKMAKKYGIDESVERRPNFLLDLDQNVVHEEGDRRSQVDVRVVSRKEKKTQPFDQWKESWEKENHMARSGGFEGLMKNEYSFHS